jgi:hypothetical protein
MQHKIENRGCLRTIKRDELVAIPDMAPEHRDGFHGKLVIPGTLISETSSAVFHGGKVNHPAQW